MSDNHHDNQHGHDHGHDESGASHGSVGSYLFGFIASLVLTAIPFALVMTHAMPAHTLIPVIVVIGVVQIIVHLIYFLHMNTSSTQSWNNLAFFFTLVILGILIIGTLWVMYHMNANMMPGMMPSASIG
jgi:cytochrome o ubiquinol oxidase operon protein cyoD